MLICVPEVTCSSDVRTVVHDVHVCSSDLGVIWGFAACCGESLLLVRQNLTITQNCPQTGGLSRVSSLFRVAGSLLICSTLFGVIKEDVNCPANCEK